jgi:hypothetical protein
MDLLLELILWFIWEFVLSVIFESVVGIVQTRTTRAEGERPMSS